MRNALKKLVISKYFKHFSKRLFVCIIMFQGTLRLFSQESSTMYFLHQIPQSNLLNPAVQIPCKIFVGMPLLSSVYAQYSNSFFSSNDAYQPVNNGININYAYLLSKPNSIQNNYIEFGISLLNFGFLYDDYYFNFNLSDKIDAGYNYPTSIFGLILKGNSPSIGSTLDLGGTKVYANYYREWAFGMSKIIDNQLTLGLKAKLLFGKANITTPQSDLSLETGPAPYHLTASGNIAVNESPLVITYDKSGKPVSADLPSDATIVSLLLNRKNKGLAFDFGTIYDLSDKVTISGSLLDLGFIYWTYSPSKLTSSAKFQYNGLDYNSQTGTFTNLNSVTDSLQNSYKISSQSSSYFTALSPKLYLGGTYKLLNNVKAGLLVREQLYHGKLMNSEVLSVNANYKNYLNGALSWTYANSSFANLGLAIGAATPNFGFYALSDNVYGAFKYKSARLINIRFGFNFLFGCKSCDSKEKSSSGKACAAYQNKDSKFQKWKNRLKKDK
jgi:hypothetical protein